jgi:hypothetical protein
MFESLWRCGRILAPQDAPQDESYPGQLLGLGELGTLHRALQVFGVVELGRICVLIRCAAGIHARSLSALSRR